MTVKELIEALEKMPPDDEVCYIGENLVRNVTQVYHVSEYGQHYVMVSEW